MAKIISTSIEITIKNEVDTSGKMLSTDWMDRAILSEYDVTEGTTWLKILFYLADL